MALVFGSPLENDADAFGPGANYEVDGVDNNFSGLAASPSTAMPLLEGVVFPLSTTTSAQDAEFARRQQQQQLRSGGTDLANGTASGSVAPRGAQMVAPGRHRGRSRRRRADVDHHRRRSSGGDTSSSSSGTHEFGDSRSSSSDGGSADDEVEGAEEYAATISSSYHTNQHHHPLANGVGGWASPNVQQSLFASAAALAATQHDAFTNQGSGGYHRGGGVGIASHSHPTTVVDDFEDTTTQLATTSSFTSRASQQASLQGGAPGPRSVLPGQQQGGAVVGVLGINGRTSSGSSMVHSPPPTFMQLAASPSHALQAARSHRSSLLLSRSDDFAVRSPPVAPMALSVAHHPHTNTNTSSALHGGPLVSVDDNTAMTDASSVQRPNAATWEEVELQAVHRQPQQHSVDELIARTLREEALVDESDGEGHATSGAATAGGPLRRVTSTRRHPQQQQQQHIVGPSVIVSSGSFASSAPPSDVAVQLAPPTRIASTTTAGWWAGGGSSATSGAGGSFIESNATDDHHPSPQPQQQLLHPHHHPQQTSSSVEAPPPGLLQLPALSHLAPPYPPAHGGGGDVGSSFLNPSSRLGNTLRTTSGNASLLSPAGEEHTPRMSTTTDSSSLQQQQQRQLYPHTYHVSRQHLLTTDDHDSSAMSPSASTVTGGGPPLHEWGSQPQHHRRASSPTATDSSGGASSPNRMTILRGTSSASTSRPLPIHLRHDGQNPLAEGSSTDNEEQRRATRRPPRPPLLCLPQEVLLLLFHLLGSNALILRATCMYVNDYFLLVAMDRLKPVLQPSPFSWTMLRSTNEVLREDRLRRVRRTLSHHRKLAHAMKHRITGQKATVAQSTTATHSRQVPVTVYDPWQQRNSASEGSSVALPSTVLAGPGPSPFAALMGGPSRGSSPPLGPQQDQSIARNPLSLPPQASTSGVLNPHSSDSALSLGAFPAMRRDSSAIISSHQHLAAGTTVDSPTPQLHVVVPTTIGGNPNASNNSTTSPMLQPSPAGAPHPQMPPFSSLIMTEAKHFLDVPGAATTRFMRQRSGSDVERDITHLQRQTQQRAALAAAQREERRRQAEERRRLREIRHKLKRQLATRQWLQELAVSRRVKANVCRALFDSVTIEKQSHAPPIILPNGTICFSRWHLVAVFVRTTEGDSNTGLPLPNSSKWIKTGYLGSHTDTVTGMRFDARLQCLLTSSFDGSIKRWNLRGAGSDGRATGGGTNSAPGGGADSGGAAAASQSNQDANGNQKEGLFLCQASYKVTVGTAIPVFPIFSFDIVHLKNYRLSSTDKAPYSPPSMTTQHRHSTSSHHNDLQQRKGSHGSWVGQPPIATTGSLQDPLVVMSANSSSVMLAGGGGMMGGGSESTAQLTSQNGGPNRRHSPSHHRLNSIGANHSNTSNTAVHRGSAHHSNNNNASHGNVPLSSTIDSSTAAAAMSSPTSTTHHHHQHPQQTALDGANSSATSTQVLFADDLLRHAMNPHRGALAVGLGSQHDGGNDYGGGSGAASGRGGQWAQQRSTIGQQQQQAFAANIQQQQRPSHSNPHQQHHPRSQRGTQQTSYHPPGSTIGVLNEDSSLIACGSEFGSVALMHVDAHHSATLGIATIADTRVRQIKFFNTVIFDDVVPPRPSTGQQPPFGSAPAPGIHIGQASSGGAFSNQSANGPTPANVSAAGGASTQSDDELLQQGIVYLVVSTFNGVFLLSHIIYRKVCVVTRSDLGSSGATDVAPHEGNINNAVHARKGYHYFSTSLSMRRVHFFTMMELPQCVDVPRPWWHRNPARDFDIRGDAAAGGAGLSFDRVAAYAMAEANLRSEAGRGNAELPGVSAAASFQRHTSIQDDSTDAHPYFTKPLLLLICRRMPCGLVTLNPTFAHPDTTDDPTSHLLNPDHPNNRPVLERQLPFHLGAVSCAKMSPSHAFIVVALESGKIVFVSPRISSLAIRNAQHTAPVMVGPVVHGGRARLHRPQPNGAGPSAVAATTSPRATAAAVVPREQPPRLTTSQNTLPHHPRQHHFDDPDLPSGATAPPAVAAPSPADHDHHSQPQPPASHDDVSTDGGVEERTDDVTSDSFSRTKEFAYHHAPHAVSLQLTAQPQANVGDEDGDNDDDDEVDEQGRLRNLRMMSSSAGSTPPASFYSHGSCDRARHASRPLGDGAALNAAEATGPPHPQLPPPAPIVTTEHFDEVRNFFGSHVFEDPLIRRWQRKDDGVTWDILHMTAQNDRNSVLMHTTVLFHPSIEHNFLQVTNLDLDGWKLSTIDTQATVMVFNIETLVHLFTVTLFPVPHHKLPMSRLLVRAISAETASRPINPKYVVWSNGTMLVSPLPITSHTVVLDFSGQFREHEDLVPIHEVALGRSDEQIAERRRRQLRHGRGARPGAGDEFPELPVFRPVRQQGHTPRAGVAAALGVDSTLDGTLRGDRAQPLRTSAALEFVQSSGHISYHPNDLRRQEATRGSATGGNNNNNNNSNTNARHAAVMRNRGGPKRRQRHALAAVDDGGHIAIGGNDILEGDDEDELCPKGSDCSSNESDEADHDRRRFNKVADSEKWLLINVRHLAKMFGNYGGDAATYRQWWNARESVLAKMIPLQEYPLMFHILYIFAPPLVMVVITLILILVALRLDGVVSYPFAVPLALHCLLVPHYFGINVYSYKPLLAHHSGFTFYMRMFADALYLLVFPLMYVLRRDAGIMTDISWVVLSAPISVAIVLAFLAARLEDRFELRHRIALDPVGASQRYRHITGMQAVQTVLVVIFITLISAYFDDPLGGRSINLSLGVDSWVNAAWREKALTDPLNPAHDWGMSSVIFVVFTPIWIFVLIYSVHVHTMLPYPLVTADHPSDDSSGDDLVLPELRDTSMSARFRRWRRRWWRWTRHARRVALYVACVVSLYIAYAGVVVLPIVGFCLRYDRFLLCAMHPHGFPVSFNATAAPSAPGNVTGNTTLAPPPQVTAMTNSSNGTSPATLPSTVSGYVMESIECGTSTFPIYIVLVPVMLALLLVAGFATSNVVVHVRQLRRGM